MEGYHMKKIMILVILLTSCYQSDRTTLVRIHVMDIRHNPMPNVVVKRRFINETVAEPLPTLTDDKGYAEFGIIGPPGSPELPIEIIVESPDIISQTLTIIPLDNQTTTVEFRVFRKP